MTQGTRWEEAEAVARLRDAAPALLKAAKWAESVLSEYQAENPSDYANAEADLEMDKLRAAIEQAEGRRKPVGE